MSSAFRRKTYGPVKPVKQAKPVVPAKPSVVAYKKILTTMQKQQTWRSAELLMRCIVWWINAEPWMLYQFKKTTLPLDAAKAHIKARSFVQLSIEASTLDTKIKRQLDAIKAYQQMAKTLFTVPSVDEPLKKSKEVSKKLDKVNNELTARFDHTLTILASCFQASKLDFKAVTDLTHFGDSSKIHCKFDEVSKTLYYTRAYLTQMKKRIWREGLLPVLFHEMPTIAKTMSDYITVRDCGIDDMAILQKGIIDFCLNNPEAPTKLVKKPSKEKKTKIQKLKGVKVKRIKNPFNRSVSQQLLDEMGF